MKALELQTFYPDHTSGSFFIPLFLIVFLYFKIFTTQRKIAKRRKQIKGEPTCKNGGKQVKINIIIGLGNDNLFSIQNF